MPAAPVTVTEPPAPPAPPAPPFGPAPPLPPFPPSPARIPPGVGVGASVGAGVGARVRAGGRVRAGVGASTTTPPTVVVTAHGRTHVAVTILVLGHATVLATADTQVAPAGTPAGHGTVEPAGKVHVPVVDLDTWQVKGTPQAGARVGRGVLTATVVVVHGVSQVRRTSTTDLQPAGVATDL